MQRLGKFMLIALASSACGGSGFAPAVTFGADDSTCESVEIPGDAEDRQPIQDGVDCLIAEVEAGNPVIIDFSVGTVDGDQIFTRYAFDGEEILIVSDDRLDEFGANPGVSAATCQSLVSSTLTVPTGAECVAVGHDGFTNADGPSE